MVDEAQHRGDGERPESDPGPPIGAGTEAALARLDELADTPIREHVAVFEAIHEYLQDRLADPGE